MLPLGVGAGLGEGLSQSCKKGRTATIIRGGGEVEARRDEDREEKRENGGRE